MLDSSSVGLGVAEMVNGGMNMNKTRRAFLLFTAAAGAAICEGWLFNKKVAAGRAEHFLPEEKKLIEQYFRRLKKSQGKGLPPGLAKRRGNLPPGLQKQLQKNGQLPPGLQKRLEPLPVELDQQLPSLPDYWERVIVERDVILLDRRTNRILDIIENVIALTTGQ